MKQLLKFFCALLGILILLGIAAAILVVTLVNPDNFKKQISQQVYNYTGRELTINGEIHWSFFPWLGLKINDASLSEAPGFGPKPFAKIGQIDVSVKAAPLLDKKVEVGRLVLNNLELNLIKNSQGKNNWDDLGKSKSTVAKASTPSAPAEINNKPRSSRSVDFPLLVIAAADINNGTITWQNQQKNQTTIISHLNLDTPSMLPNHAFPLDLSFSIESNQPNLKGAVEAHGDVTANLTDQTFLFRNLKFNVYLTGSSLPNDALDLNLVGNLQVNLKQNKIQGHLQAEQLQIGRVKAIAPSLDLLWQNQVLSLNAIKAQMYEGQYTGNIQIDLHNKIPQYTTNSQLNNIQTKPLFQDLTNITHLQLSGVGNIDASLKTRGDNEDAILKNLMGQGHLAINNGAIEGINIPYWINMGKSILHKQVLTNIPNDNKTDFGHLTATYTINNGLLQNNDLLLQSSLLHVTGKGTANLPQEQIDYILNTQLANDTGNDGKGDIIPLQISGSFAHPTIRPVVNEIVKTQLKDQYQKNKEKIGKQLEKYLGKDTGEQIQNKLEQLFH